MGILNQTEWLGIICIIVVSLIFYFVRKSFLFSLFSASMILVYSVLLSNLDADGLLVLIGLILYWFGLIVLRVMFHRSVSIQILENYVLVKPIAINQSLVTRLGDLIRYKLVNQNGDMYYLTLFGRLVCLFVSISYAITRITK